MSPSRRRLAAWAGMVGPALFLGTFTIEGWLRPDYQALGMFISALSLGPRGAIQIANFIVLGVLLLGFSRGVAAEFPTGKASRAGPILLAIISVSFILSGPMVMDPTGTLPAQMTFHGVLHGVFGALVFSLSPATCIVFLRRFRADPIWRAMYTQTLRTAVVMGVAVLVLRVGPARPPAASNAFNDCAGLIQRLALIPFLIWIFVFALRLYLRHKPGSGASAADRSVRVGID